MKAQETLDSELVAMATLSFAESVAALVQAEHQRSCGEYVTPYGGPWGVGDATAQLQEAMRSRHEKDSSENQGVPHTP